MLERFRPKHLGAKLSGIHSNVLSGLAVTISVISLVITIFQGCQADAVGREGNEIASRPEILIKDGYVAMAWNDEGDVVDLAEYADDLDLEKSPGGELSIPSAMLVNIGRGPALDLVVDWRVKDNGMALSALSDTEIQCGEKVYRDESIDVLVLNNDAPAMHYSVRQTHRLSFIQEDEERYVSFPSIYLDLIARYCYVGLPVTDGSVDYSRDFRDTEMPEIRISVAYQNILQNRDHGSFVLRFHPIAYDKEANGSGMCMFALSSFPE